MDRSGNLYGTALGPLDLGVSYVYELAKGSSTIAVLSSISPSDGTPVGNLTIDGNGNLYGTTQLGNSGGGIIFELVHGSSTVTTLASLPSIPISNLDGLAIDSSGNLYGTTEGGGIINPPGIIFELTKGSNTINTLATFNSPGGSTGGPAIDSDGNLYDTAVSGGAHGEGSVFDLAKGSSTITTLASFNGSNGEGPIAGVIMDSSGNLYGTTNSGGADGFGTVFELANGSNTINPLASFTTNNALYPPSSLVMDSSGNLFGELPKGGDTAEGSVFELANGSNISNTLASFNVTNGLQPFGGLVMDRGDSLYGVTVGGGTNGLGTIFEIQAVAPGPHLVFLQQASNTGAGNTISSLTVAVEDQFGNIETSDNSDKITLALGPGSPKGTLNGTTTLTVSSGEATFKDLSIDQAGNGYTLAASTNVSGVSSATSNSFNITPLGPDHLVFVQGPMNTVAGAHISPAVQVAIEDKFDNVETGDNADKISLALSPSATLNGTKTQTVSGGVASFGDLAIAQAGKGYMLTASSSSVTASLASSNFNITLANVTTTASNATANYSVNAQTLTLAATVADTSVPNDQVNEGIVTFTVMNGQTVIGKKVQGTVSDG